jgi:hypothetical protein
MIFCVEFNFFTCISGKIRGFYVNFLDKLEFLRKFAEVFRDLTVSAPNYISYKTRAYFK